MCEIVVNGGESILRLALGVFFLSCCQVGEKMFQLSVFSAHVLNVFNSSDLIICVFYYDMKMICMGVLVMCQTWKEGTVVHCEHCRTLAMCCFSNCEDELSSVNIS